MATQHIETLIIGAGQAGLATGYHLRKLGREFLVVDGNERVGDNWRCHWDSLRLFTPAKYDGLPGLTFPGDPWSFPGKEEVADYLETYALEMDLPVRLQTRVERLETRAGGGFTAHLGAQTITSENVVVATGTRGRTPHVPEFAGSLAPSIRQLHSTGYQRPSQLSDGPTLVVGASHSGCEIAHELADHLPVRLCGRYTGNEPFAPGSGWDRIFTPLMVLVANHVLTRRTPPGRKVMAYLRGPHHGAPAARIKRRHLAARGVRWLEQRVTGVSEDGSPMLADGTVLDVTTVIWCTGFEQHFEWIDVPVCDEQGWPREYRGVVDEAPGLYFCGLVFQFAFSSMVLPGVGRDARMWPAGSRTAAGTAAQSLPDAVPPQPSCRYRHERRGCAMGVVDDLHRAREAYERREWVSAYRTLSGVEESTLTAGDFVALATTAYLLGQRNDCVQATQRAYKASVDDGDVLGAVRCALWLAIVLFEGGESAIGSGWVARAQRLLNEVEGEVVERGYMLQMQTFVQIMTGDLAEAAAGAKQVTGYGRRFHDPDLLAVGMNFEGRLAIYSGRVADGLRFLDEAMVGVLAGELSPIYCGMVYCSAIEACQEVSDLGRAGEWTHALTTWCESQPGLVAFTGQCAVHRGQLMRLHGAYAEALAELDRAAARYAARRRAPGDRAGVLRARGDPSAPR